MRELERMRNTENMKICYCVSRDLKKKKDKVRKSEKKKNGNNKIPEIQVRKQ